MRSDGHRRPTGLRRNRLVEIATESCDRVPCTTCGGNLRYLAELERYLSRVTNVAHVLSRLRARDVREHANNLALRRIVRLLDRVSEAERNAILLHWLAGPAKEPDFAEALLSAHRLDLDVIPEAASTIISSLLPKALQRDEDGQHLRRQLRRSFPEEVSAHPEIASLLREDAEDWERGAPERDREYRELLIEERRAKAAYEARLRFNEEIESLRADLVKTLQPLSVEVRLLKLANADEKTALAWPAEFLEISDADVAALPDALQVRLLKRFKRKRRGRIHRLCGRIHVFRKTLRDTERRNDRLSPPAPRTPVL